MKPIETPNSNSLYQRPDLIVKFKAAHITEPDSHVNIIGEGDGAYLLIDKYTGEHTATAYFFKPEPAGSGLQSGCD